MWAFNRRFTIRALTNQTKSISVKERGLTNSERERARERGGQNWLTMNLLYSHKLSDKLRSDWKTRKVVGTHARGCARSLAEE